MYCTTKGYMGMTGQSFEEGPIYLDEDEDEGNNEDDADLGEEDKDADIDGGMTIGGPLRF